MRVPARADCIRLARQNARNASRERVGAQRKPRANIAIDEVLEARIGHLRALNVHIEVAPEIRVLGLPLLDRLRLLDEVVNLCLSGAGILEVSRNFGNGAARLEHRIDDAVSPLEAGTRFRVKAALPTNYPGVARDAAAPAILKDGVAVCVQADAGGAILNLTAELGDIALFEVAKCIAKVVADNLFRIGAKRLSLIAILAIFQRIR